MIEVLKELNPSTIYCMKSIPGGEGELTANELSPLSRVVPDETGLELIKARNVDLVLLGCDAFVREKGFVNKIGSKQICKVADTKQLPVVVVTSKLKEVNEIPKAVKSIFEWVSLQEFPRVNLITD